MSDGVLALLEESRKRERSQALFYRRMAALAASVGDEGLTDRFNDLHADEQHHLSRLTARVFELGGVPVEIPGPDVRVPPLEDWEGEARSREEEEVRWYRGVLEQAMDEDTRQVFREIRDSEEHHARDLAGKWMSA